MGYAGTNPSYTEFSEIQQIKIRDELKKYKKNILFRSMLLFYCRIIFIVYGHCRKGMEIYPLAFVWLRRLWPNIMVSNSKLNGIFQVHGRNEKKAISGREDFGSIWLEMRGILPNIAIIFITIPWTIGCVKFPKIGSFPVFIGLSPRGFIHQIGAWIGFQKCQKAFGMNDVKVGWV